MSVAGDSIRTGVWLFPDRPATELVELASVSRLKVHARLLEVPIVDERDARLDDREGHRHEVVKRSLEPEPTFEGDRVGCRIHARG